MNRPDRLRALLATACLLAAAPGCGDSGLPNYTRLGGLRLLALVADAPETAPGATVTLTPVVSDLPSSASTGGRALSYSAEACLDPGVGLGASPTCEGRADRVAVASGAIPSLASAANTHTGAAPPINVTIPALALAGRAATDQFNGVAYLVIYTLSAANASGAPSTLTSFKRIIVSTRPAKNANPVIASVQAGGTQTLSAFLAALAFPGTAQPKVILAPSFSAGSAETYLERQANGTDSSLTEELTTTWFVSDGDFNRFRTVGTDGNDWTPPSAQPSRPGLVIVAVTRDGRGGEDYEIFEK